MRVTVTPSYTKIVNNFMCTYRQKITKTSDYNTSIH